MHSFATTLCMASAVATEAAVMRNAYSLASRSIFQLRSLVGFPSNGIERDEEGGTKAKQTRSFQRVPSRSTASLALDFGTQVELAEEKKGRRDFDSSRSTLLCRTPRPCTARSSQVSSDTFRALPGREFGNRLGRGAEHTRVRLSEDAFLEARSSSRESAAASVMYTSPEVQPAADERAPFQLDCFRRPIVTDSKRTTGSQYFSR
ncbi:uncharacterized protein LOC142585729 isoform X1 [Dermacentor variabilis]|uniref:uncharacterized protein LOC142585729 isoform X1 n=1 Tax=Dermacentor variabilis TaxID=34621 RepID=UPI003F5C4DE1